MQVRPKIPIDHELQPIDVYPARRHVGGYEYGQLTTLKLVENVIALSLPQVEEG